MYKEKVKKKNNKCNNRSRHLKPTVLNLQQQKVLFFLLQPMFEDRKLSQDRMGGWGQIWVCVWFLCLDLSFLGLLKMDCWVCVCILADVCCFCVWLTRNGKKTLENLGSVHNHQQATIKSISSKPKRSRIPTRKTNQKPINHQISKAKNSKTNSENSTQQKMCSSFFFRIRRFEIFYYFYLMWYF